MVLVFVEEDSFTLPVEITIETTAHFEMLTLQQTLILFFYPQMLRWRRTPLGTSG
ncbi:hypothetical protein CF161_23571 [Pseudomonas sp. CF161]|nr:hypothetical protein CF161_23571 [Pseudomonas sp. CF161]